MIHTRVYTYKDRLPGGGTFLYRAGEGRLSVWGEKIPPDGYDVSAIEPFILELLEWTKKGERCRCKEVYGEEEAEAILFPNSSLVAQAIRDVGADICAILEKYKVERTP